MAERVKTEILHAKEKREVFSSAVEHCQEQLEHSVKSISINVRNKIYPYHFVILSFANKELVASENKNILQLNKNINSTVEGFQERMKSCDSQLESFIDNASSLDYFDKWVRNIKGKLYDVSHIMEEICQIEQDELRSVE